MIQNHLTSQPLSKRLEKLGVPQVSEFYWQECADSTNNWSFGKTTTNYGLPVENYYSAFLSSELGEMLPSDIENGKWLLTIYSDTNEAWSVQYKYNWIGKQSLPLEETSGNTLAEALGLMLEYLILNGLIKL